jgi:uncharacterized damage-inducible protein DinB
MIKAFFLGLVFLSLSSQAQRVDSLFMAAAIAKQKHAKAYTIEVARRMPAEKYGFKPSQEEMSFDQQILHTMQLMQFLCKTFLNGGANPVKIPDSPQDKDETIKLLNNVYDYTISTLENFNPAQLPDTVSFFVKPTNKLQIINLLNDHQTHHRAQLVVYLRINGIKPPDYVGW